MTITGGTVGTAANGGGLANDGGTATLTNCTVSGNSAGNMAAACYELRRHDHADQLHRQRQLRRISGGGLSTSSGTITLTNCTVSGNSPLAWRRAVTTGTRPR